jgi:DNA mismatch endonuclease (patch repair protein)
LHADDLPGRPDIVFRRQRVAIFCDGDFWHGRNLSERLAKLSGGHNGEYWTTKLSRNVRRDRLQTRVLGRMGWAVVRLWETEILRDPEKMAAKVIVAIDRAGRRDS